MNPNLPKRRNRYVAEQQPEPQQQPESEPEPQQQSKQQPEPESESEQQPEPKQPEQQPKSEQQQPFAQRKEPRRPVRFLKTVRNNGTARMRCLAYTGGILIFIGAFAPHCGEGNV